MKDLTDDDRVERIIQKSDRDEMLRQLSREISRCVKLQSARTTRKFSTSRDSYSGFSRSDELT